MIPILDIMLSNLWKPVIKVFTTCTTRCRFVNVAFGFAARKASRHQLYKTRECTCLFRCFGRITLNSVQAVVGIHMIMSITRFAWHNFRIPRFGKSKLDLANRRISCNSGSGKHIFTFTLISCTAKKWPLGLWGIKPVHSVSRRTCICCVPKYTRVGLHGRGNGPSPSSCVRAFALHVYALDTRYHDYMP